MKIINTVDVAPYVKELEKELNEVFKKHKKIFPYPENEIFFTIQSNGEHKIEVIIAVNASFIKII